MIIEQIRKGIKTSGKSLNQIGRETGIDKAALSRIMQGGSCKVETADILLKYFGIELATRKRNAPDKEYVDVDPEIRGLLKYFKQSFGPIAKDPESWLSKAVLLKEAADAYRNSFWPKKRKVKDLCAAQSDFLRGPVYMLLSGLAIETIIKAIIVATRPEVVEEQRLSAELTNHNLNKLYDIAGLLHNNPTKELLSRLQRYIEIFGRYPVARTKKEMEKMLNTRFGGETDFTRIDRLWDFLHSKIRRYIQSEE